MFSHAFLVTTIFMHKEQNIGPLHYKPSALLRGSCCAVLGLAESLRTLEALLIKASIMMSLTRSDACNIIATLAAGKLRATDSDGWLCGVIFKYGLVEYLSLASLLVRPISSEISEKRSST